MTGPAMRRLFVAGELSASVREALASVQEDLRRRAGEARVRWTRPEGIHLTLKFLGEVASERLAVLAAALGRALAGQPALRLRLAGLGSFGGARRLRVIWVGLAGDLEPLARLAVAVDAALAGEGFPREKRPFSPHLTLGRVADGVRPEARVRLHEVLEAAPPPPAMPVHLARVCLMQSTLGPGGARYAALESFSLA